MDNWSETTKLISRRKKPQVLYLFGLFVFSFLMVFSVFVISANSALPPPVMTYQGKILVGGSSATTALNMYFLLYDASSGGNLLYTAAGTLGSPASISVTPNAGLFSVIFGEGGTNALDPNIFKNNSDMYLEVQVEAETLLPRKRITTAPYAFNAQFLGGFAPSQTPTNTAYIPVSDDDGNFNFGSVTTTNLYSTGNITASGSVQSNLYCDADGLNCFDPSSGWVTGPTQLVTTTASYNGAFATGTLIGYQAANDICKARLAGSHFCRTDEIISFIQTQDISFFAGTAWIAEGPPGYTANSNDCNGWTSSSDTMLGPFWQFIPNGGGMGWLVNCSVTKPIACCK